MAYDVGAIVRDTQAEFNLFGVHSRGKVGQKKLNRATPENLALLLGALVTFTDELVAWRAAMDADQDWRQRVLGTTGIEGLAIVDDDLAAWHLRLDGYIFDVSKAPPGDRQDVLWDVTAPLLLGFYGGPDSAAGQSVADVATPFSIANRLLVSDEWQREAFDAWQADTIASYANAVDVAGLIPRAAAGAVVDAVDEAIDAAFDFAKLLGVLVPLGVGALVLNAVLRSRRRSR